MKNFQDFWRREFSRRPSQVQHHPLALHTWGKDYPNWEGTRYRKTACYEYMQLFYFREKNFSYSESFSYEVARMFAYILLMSMNEFKIHGRLLQNSVSQEKPMVLHTVKRATSSIRDKVFSVTSTYSHLCLAGPGNFRSQENWPLFLF